MALPRVLVGVGCLAVSVLAAGCSVLEGGDVAQARVSAIPPEQQQLEPLLEGAVLVALGRGIPVRCWTADEWPSVLADSGAEIDGLPPGNVLGVAVTDGASETINLSPRVCEPLAALARNPTLPPAGPEAVELAQALVTVGHEAGHLVARLESEAEAECFGAQHVTRVARALGMSEAEGTLLATLYWGEVYPTSDPIYQSPECHDGGALDLDPWSSNWP
jgi:hypothetical protein